MPTPTEKGLATLELINGRLTVLQKLYEEAKKESTQKKIRTKIDALLECWNAVNEGVSVTIEFVDMAMEDPTKCIQAAEYSRELNAEDSEPEGENVVHTEA